jgi:hypothetical protein
LGDSPASEFYVPTFRNTLFHLHVDGESRKNNQDEIVGVFIWEKVWLENSLSQSEGGGACPSTETGCGGQRPQVETINLIPAILPAYSAHEDGTDSVF